MSRGLQENKNKNRKCLLGFCGLPKLCIVCPLHDMAQKPEPTLNARSSSVYAKEHGRAVCTDFVAVTLRFIIYVTIMLSNVYRHWVYTRTDTSTVP